MSQTAPDRSEQKIQKRDINEGSILRDNIYNEQVEVVGLHVGQVYLRYPHHEDIQFYRCDCGAILEGMGSLKDHAEDCQEVTVEWFEKVLDSPLEDYDDIKPFERIERDGYYMESDSYHWPLDGHRFTIVEK